MYEHTHEFINPFTKQPQIMNVDITEAMDEAIFIETKKTISEHLSNALARIKSEPAKESEATIGGGVVDESERDSRITALEYLIVQMYQPKDYAALAVKLLTFQDALFEVPEYNEVMLLMKGREV